MIPALHFGGTGFNGMTKKMKSTKYLIYSIFVCSLLSGQRKQGFL
jgi:hypothetical protein